MKLKVTKDKYQMQLEEIPQSLSLYTIQEFAFHHQIQHIVWKPYDDFETIKKVHNILQERKHRKPQKATPKKVWNSNHWEHELATYFQLKFT